MSLTKFFYFSAFTLVLALTLNQPAVVLIRAAEEDQTFLFHFCSAAGTGKFPAGDPYQTNLNNLFAYLSLQAPSTGFSKGSVGQSPNQVSGVTLCRGDASPAICRDCITQAAGEILNRCPNDKAAVVFYDNCLLKYSDTEFFGQIDNRNRFYMWNLRNVSDPAAFNGKTRALLTELAGEAVMVEGGRLFAAGETELGGGKLYGMTHCSRDISGSVCKKCLDGIIGELPSCCDGKEGGRVVGPSCNFRYEIYPFLN